MWQRHCALLVLLGAAFANAIPVWFYNTGLQNTYPIGFKCSSFTREYNPYTGYISYRCNPDIKINKPLSLPILVKSSDMDSAEDDYLTQETLQSSGRSGTQHDKATYRSLTSGRSGSRKKDKRPKRPTYNRRNRCPAGQIFQSELNICIDYPSAPPLPPRRPSNSRLNPYDSMMGDEPVRTYAALRKPTPVSGTILAVGKIDLKNRCKPSEVYVSEIDICLPRNNCYPHSSTC